MTLESATRFQAEQSSPFELKGSLFTLTVLHLRKADSKAIAFHLAQKALQAPEFFKNLPVVIDLESLDPTAELDFAELYGLLRRNGLIPVGVRNASSQLQTAAIRADIPLLLENRSDTAKATQEKLLPPSPGAPTPLPEGTLQHNKIVTHPIRSGQQVYVPNGDLIVLGPISAGSELLADGNIHVYGTLRGRALAGVKGNTQARIFCQLLEAELVSVAGHYRVIEDLDKDNPGKPVQLYLEEDRLIISPLFK